MRELATIDSVSRKHQKYVGIAYLASVSILKSRWLRMDAGSATSSLSARSGTTDGKDVMASARAAVLSSSRVYVRPIINVIEYM